MMASMVNGIWRSRVRWDLGRYPEGGAYQKGEGEGEDAVCVCRRRRMMEDGGEGGKRLLGEQYVRAGLSQDGHSVSKEAPRTGQTG